MTASVDTRRASALRRFRRGHAPGESRVGSIIVLVLVTVAVLTPFVWVISLSFTPESEAFGSVSLVPAHPTLDNYATAFVDADLARALFNSIVVGGVTVLTNCLFAVLAGYAFAMLPFPGNRAVFYTLISTAAIPISVTLIPLFLMARGIPLVGGNDILGQGGSGLLNTLAGVILPYIVMPMNIFLARQFFTSAPLELGEAARMDGAGELRIFFRVYLPLAKPLIAVVAIFSFTGVWDDFLWPLVVTTSEEVQTVQLALARFLGSGNVQYGPLMAGTVIATIPVLVVFLFNQRSFISGLADGSVKG
ncbi:carbohydrate ABC transporter permease [Herbiconiux sp. P18]|uniref:carbohydrate ABC transporter permease n=1 Tax=Herbiconiux liangxiaofengii TaxID=3342795 RepID=UPI0035B79FF5